jgi:catechol 2,3-dioxygenase-like lactoylglutathione lyase family enzyme
MAVTGLGHIGIFVRDLERMVAFYRDFLGLRVTKQNWRAGTVFLSANPQAADHELALVRGRPDGADPHLIQQISFSVASLNDVRQFHRRLVREEYRIQRVVNHASAIGCYFYDPEGNCAEVFWLTGRPSWVPVSVPIDLELPDEAILAEVEKLWRKVRHVGMGERMADEPATLKMNY